MSFISNCVSQRVWNSLSFSSFSLRLHSLFFSPSLGGTQVLVHSRQALEHWDAAPAIHTGLMFIAVPVIWLDKQMVVATS